MSRIAESDAPAPRTAARSRSGSAPGSTRTAAAPSETSQAFSRYAPVAKPWMRISVPLQPYRTTRAM